MAFHDCGAERPHGWGAAAGAERRLRTAAARILVGVRAAVTVGWNPVLTWTKSSPYVKAISAAWPPGTTQVEPWLGTGNPVSKS